MTIITNPNDVSPDGNKYGVELGDVEPAAVLAAVHKRMIGNEQKIVNLTNHLSNFEIDIVNMKEKVEALTKGLVELDKLCQKLKKNHNQDGKE